MKHEDDLSRAELAYFRLIDAIRNGVLAPGTRVREVEIADRFGISRTPVREAIRRLENEGLVVHVPRQGAVVKRMDRREITELYEMREVLEGTAARMAAQHASEMEIAELEELNALMLEAADDPARVAELNRQFHAVLHQLAKNRFLIDAVTALSNALTLLGGTTLAAESRVETAHAEHEQILTCIRGRDQAGADEAARSHIRSAQMVRMRLLRETLD